VASLVGLIGIGRIGGRLAANLLASGVEVFGFDIAPRPDFIARGGKLARSPAEVAAAAAMILHSLPSVAALRQVLEGPDGLLAHCGSGHIIADLSTYLLKDKTQARDDVARTGAVFLDCQITGSPEMLRERRGTIFVSGDRAAAQRCEPVFAAAVDRQFFLGDFGTATKLKTANNLLVALNAAAAAEAMAVAVQAGIDPKLAVEILGGGAGQSQMFTQRAPLMAERNYPGTSATLGSFTIYLDLVDAALAELPINAPLARAAAVLYRQAIAAGHGEEDMASIYELVNPRGKPAAE
jgi:3-hydroxyisobutyrate dehydrogenase